MSEPMIVEVTRGPLVESRHRVRAAIIDDGGNVLFSAGDIEAPVFARSAIKVLQALPLLETGAADAAGLTDEELAMACASHSGEEGHVALAAGMLARSGLEGRHLECGCHWPLEMPVALRLAKSGAEPSALHNNCSGKHAGFLCTAVHMGEQITGYIAPDHPVQQRARAAIAETAGVELRDDQCGTDGCSIPTYAAPLTGFARAFARLASGTGVSAERARAGQRLIAANIAHPFAMSGTGRKCLRLIEAGAGRVYAKTGAEGVFCGAVPDLGIGFALKAEDGATRAAECAVAFLLAGLMRRHDADIAERFEELATIPLRNWEKRHIGEVRVANTGIYPA